MRIRPGTPLHSPRRSHMARATASLLLAAACVGLPACQSALSRNDGQSDSDKYYQSLVVREIIRGTYGEKALAGGAAPTLIGAVREIVPVDSAGPGSTTTYPAPATNPSIGTASLIGLSSATLRTTEPVLGLSLQEAIARTVQHSLAIKLEAYNPAIKQSLIIETDANTFDPVAFGQSQWATNDDPQLATSFSNGSTWTNNIGVRKVLPTGTQIQSSIGFTNRDISVPFGSPSPGTQSSYTANINLQLKQPLLRGFGEDVNQANIYLAQRDLRISQSQFKQKVISTVADVEDAYQNLVLARTNMEVLVRLVVASEQTYKDVYARKDIDATTASINQALSALENRRADLHVAQKQFRNASDKLKTLINDPDMDIDSNILIDPTDHPIVEPLNYNTLDCIELALQQRPEMQQARLQLEKADIVIKVAKNDLLPKVDLTLAMQVNGQDHGLDQAFTQSIDPANAIDYTVGISFEMPIGDRGPKAALDRHENERRQAITDLVSVAKQVVQNVKQELRDVYSSYEEIAIRDRVREAAAREFQGIIDLETIRPRSPEFLQLKLDSQARLALAEQNVTQVIVNYNLAIMRLEQAKGTLLEFDRISLDKAPKPPRNASLDVLRIQGSTDLSKPPAK